MTRCWEMKQNSNQIVQDILELPRLLEKIVHNKGIVVHGEALRNDHRARRVAGHQTGGSTEY